MGVRDSQSKTPPRQITLPLRIAMRIAYQNIRMRLSRNLLVTSGILLGVAFLISTLVMDLTVCGMREWVAEAHLSPRFAVLAQEQNDLENRLAAKTAVAREDADRNRGAGDLSDAEQIQIADRLAAVRAELNSPLQLEAKLRDNGVPVTVEEIAGDRIQTRWLLGLGLLVAFIGILNAMLMSVTERFREIGTMKCLGALDGFIIRLFLLESLLQGVVGTTLGILIGVLLSLMAQTVRYGYFAWKGILPVQLAQSIGICFLIGLGLTVAGAIYPAWLAARMQPIAAMRVEP
jgi:ABC-type lipoprotein release transport system permease subunit